LTKVKVLKGWTELLEWTTGMDYWTELLEWTTGLNYWNGLLFLHLKSFLWPITRFPYL